MLFNSFEFLCFLPIVFILYWLLPKKAKWQNGFIVIASYIFYGWWDWRFCLLLAFTTFSTYYSGIIAEKAIQSSNQKSLKAITITNIILNLAILGVFKYFNFFSESFTDFLNVFGLKADKFTLNLILPVGISFYTFQALSYTIGIYQRKMQPNHDLLSFITFVSFFPQLLAGPIERAKNMLPQYSTSRRFDYSLAVDGCRQILCGLLKKIVIADSLAVFVNSTWDNYTSESGLMLLICAFLYTFQIYCDFSGYSDIAIGTAKLFGIRVMRNFNYPYFSRSIPEFWRRWHMSLMQWFRDYIYFPLGGSRCSKVKAVRNLFIVFGVSGLWHGANWTFILWGLYHGALSSIYKIFNISTKYNHDVGYGRVLPTLKELGQILLTFVLVMFGWILFRADNITQACDYIVRMCSSSIFDVNNLYWRKGLVYCVALVIVEWLQRSREYALQLPQTGVFKYRIVRWSIYYIIVIIMFMLSTPSNNFIYSQF